MSCIDLPPNSREEEVARFTRAKETLIVRGVSEGNIKINYKLSRYARSGVARQAPNYRQITNRL